MGMDAILGYLSVLLAGQKRGAQGAVRGKMLPSAILMLIQRFRLRSCGFFLSAFDRPSVSLR
jgi:hypothetical protein